MELEGDGEMALSVCPSVCLSAILLRFPYICRQTAHWIEHKFGKGSWTHYGTLQAWLTVGHALLISSLFQASDWSSSFRACTDKPLKRLSTNLVDELIMALLRPDYLLVMLRWIPVILWLLIVQQFLHICRQRADQIELKFGRPTNYGAPLAWPTYGHALLNSLLFPGHWLVKQCFCTFADKLLVGLSSNLVDELMIGYLPGLQAFAGKLLIQLTSNLEGELMALPRHDGSYQDWLSNTPLNPRSDLPPPWITPQRAACIHWCPVCTVETPYSTIPYTTIFDITRWAHGPQNLQRPIRTLIVLLGFRIKQIFV